MTSPRVARDPLEGRRHRITERPFLLTGLVVATICIVTTSAALLADVFTWPSDVVELAAKFILAIVAVAILTRMHAWRLIGFHRLGTLRDLRFFWIPLFPALIAMPAAVAELAGLGPTRALERLAFWLVLATLVGFVEEVSFRGLILRALAPRGIWLAAVTSSLLFGLMHLLNLLSGTDLDATLVKVGYATALGFAFAAVALRTGVIWLLVTIHALVDVVAFTTNEATTTTDVTGDDVLVSAVYAAMFTVYGILVLRGLRAPPDGHGSVVAARSQRKLGGSTMTASQDSDPKHPFPVELLPAIGLVLGSGAGVGLGVALAGGPGIVWGIVIGAGLGLLVGAVIWISIRQPQR